MKLKFNYTYIFFIFFVLFSFISVYGVSNSSFSDRDFLMGYAKTDAQECGCNKCHTIELDGCSGCHNSKQNQSDLTDNESGIKSLDKLDTDGDRTDIGQSENELPNSDLPNQTTDNSNNGKKNQPRK